MSAFTARSYRHSNVYFKTLTKSNRCSQLQAEVADLEGSVAEPDAAYVKAVSRLARASAMKAAVRANDPPKVVLLCHTACLCSLSRQPSTWSGCHTQWLASMLREQI